MNLGNKKCLEELTMKSKSYFLFLVIVLVLSAFSGLCFASDDTEPVVYNAEYPQLGFKAHSWITESGNETIAHTQIINIATGAVVKQIDKKCDYNYDVQSFCDGGN
jgi:hypothetical protein